MLFRLGELIERLLHHFPLGRLTQFVHQHGESELTGFQGGI